MHPVRLLLGCLSLLLSCASAFAQSYSFTRFAGMPPQRGYADGIGTLARFDLPGAVAIDAAGNLYVADVMNHAIRKVTSAGVVTTLAGSPGQSGAIDGTGSSARFNEPSALTLDSAGNVYVSDFQNHSIRKVSPNGVVTTFAGENSVKGSNDGTGTTAHFYYPFGIVADSDGNVYVADRGNRTIRKITSAGVVSTLAGAAGIPGVSDGTGSSARFNGLTGLAIDTSGNLYAADGSSHTIRKITGAGVVTTLAGSPLISGTANGTGAAARFNMPRGLAVDKDGNVYVADTFNNRIRKITPDGVATTFAGSLLGNANGSGTTARFCTPSAVAIDASGNLYVADTDNHSIRKITTAAVVSLYPSG